jgi:glycosyltransferase involved in cell wall biosynthesis
MDSFHQGGTERQAVQLLRLLCESGRYNVRVATLNDEGVLREEVARLGFKEIPSFPLNSFYDAGALKQLRRLRAYLRENKIEVVHAHDFYTNIFGMTAAALARTPARVASRRETEHMRTPAQKFVERRAYNLAHAVVANADAVRRQLVKEGVPARKVAVVYNGLDTARFESSVTARSNSEADSRRDDDARRDDALAALGLPTGRRFVTIVANMRLPVKDQQTFLRAARRVREADADAAFVLAGEGELTDTLREYAAQLGLEHETFFVGRCARVPKLLAASDVCVLSSKAEGFSNAILEYMAASRPVVATDVGGAREAVVEGETGYLVGVGDDETMAARIVSLLKDRARAREMGRRGRSVVEQKFSCEAQLRRTEELYESLLARAGAKVSRGIEGMREKNA